MLPIGARGLPVLPARGSDRAGLVGNSTWGKFTAIVAARSLSTGWHCLAKHRGCSSSRAKRPAAEAAHPPHGMQLYDFTEDLHDFADTAALIDNLDLVISVDTAVVHLAGALGKPVWLLNRFDTCFRWLQNREDSPWYQSLRQFRQPTPGDWANVIGRARDALQRLADGDHSQLRPQMLTS